MPEITSPAEDFSERQLFTDDAEKCRKIKELRKSVEHFDDRYRRTDDLFLCRFLHWCDWDVKKTQVQVEKLFKLKDNHPEWFFHKPIANYNDLFNHNIKFVLDKRDKRGRRVFVTKLGNIDFSTMAVTDLANLDDIWFEWMLSDIETLDNGVTCLIDLSGYSLRGFRFLTPGNIRVGSAKADLLPLKNIEFHVINSSTFLNAAVAILYPMLSKKIKESVHFHYSNWDSLHEYIPKEILPEEYGGTCGSDFDYPRLYDQLLGNSARFDKLLKYGTRIEIERSVLPTEAKDKPSGGRKKGSRVIEE